MTEHNYDARDAAIARGLMGWHTKINSTLEGEKTSWVAPDAQGYEDIHTKPPAYHKDPVAANRVRQKLLEIVNIQTDSADGKHEKCRLLELDNTYKKDLFFFEECGDDWMQALVLAVTEEGASRSLKRRWRTNDTGAKKSVGEVS